MQTGESLLTDRPGLLAQPQAAELTAEKVVVTQPAQGEYRAFSAVCTHVGCILNKIANGTIDCPCHGSEFTIATGAVVAGPAPAPLPKKKIKIEGGKVILLPG